MLASDILLGRGGAAAPAAHRATFQDDSLGNLERDDWRACKEYVLPHCMIRSVGHEPSILDVMLLCRLVHGEIVERSRWSSRHSGPASMGGRKL